MTNSQSKDWIRAALSRAAEVLGGADKLARRLKVPEADIKRWLAGHGSPGTGIFLQVIDILNEEPRSKDPNSGTEP